MRLIHSVVKREKSPSKRPRIRSSYDDSDVDEFYRELQSLVDQTPKQDILVVQCGWNAKVGEDAQEDWGEVVDLPAIQRPMTEDSSSWTLQQPCAGKYPVP